MKKRSTLRDFVEGLWGACLVAVALFTPFLRGWRRWGASDSEVQRTLPGDELVPHVKGGFTQTITISAPREQVWGWVVQLGQERGGFYSYDFLENLVGSNIHTVDTLVPEYAHTQDSTGLRTHPSIPAMPLVSMEPAKLLLFSGSLEPGKPTSWLFYLEEMDGSTRLISRWLFDRGSGFGNALSYYMTERISWVMGRKMLLGIKQRAETNTANS